MDSENHNTLTTNKPNARQIEQVLNEIANDASAAQRLCWHLREAADSDPDAADVMLAGLQALVERIGLAADAHAAIQVRGDVRGWLMSPAYHWLSDEEPGVAHD